MSHIFIRAPIPSSASVLTTRWFISNTKFSRVCFKQGPCRAISMGRPYQTVAKIDGPRITNRAGLLPTTKKQNYSTSPSRGDNAATRRAYIALGSNVGDRLDMIEKACRALDTDPDMRVTRTSSLYETEPMYVEDQARFLNGACEVSLGWSIASIFPSCA